MMNKSVAHVANEVIKINRNLFKAKKKIAVKKNIKKKKQKNKRRSNRYFRTQRKRYLHNEKKN